VPREFARTRIAWSELAMATLIGPAVSLSEPFEDGIALLRVAELRGLEGVAPGCDVQVGRMSRLAQGQDGGVARGQPGAMAVI